MPELPEVETIRRQLQPNCRQQVIQKVTLKLPRILLESTPTAFKRGCRGQQIRSVLRRGKYLIIELNRFSLVVHLGMTGQLTFVPKEAPLSTRYKKTVTGLEVAQGPHTPDKHTHLILEFDKGDRLFFRDVRTFGKILFLPGTSWETHPRFAKMGPEPLELKIETFVDTKFPIKGQRSIKALLLDQTFICGVGNIYCDEALFRAGVHPESIVSEISKKVWIKLLSSVQEALKQGLENSGTTFKDFRQSDNTEGHNQENLLVYGRGGKPCTRCKKVLEKIVVAQRGTVYCSKCQKLFS